MLYNDNVTIPLALGLSSAPASLPFFCTVVVIPSLPK